VLKVSLGAKEKSMYILCGVLGIFAAGFIVGYLYGRDEFLG
jgi:hypothetical protein